MDRSYIAFISYRHTDPDKAVAEKLHQLIERYHVPKGIGKEQKRLGIAFRDQEELPVSGDLGQDIYNALDHSEFLIVVCSPRTPESMWVTREIEYFLSHHDYRHVLTVLVEGEPDDSFPHNLTHPFPDEPASTHPPFRNPVL